MRIRTGRRAFLLTQRNSTNCSHLEALTVPPLLNCPAQTDNPARDAGGRLVETMVLRHVVPRDGIDASAEAGNHPGRQRGRQGGPPRSNLSEIPGPKDRSSVQEPAQFLILGRGHGVTLQTVGT